MKTTKKVTNLVLLVKEIQTGFDEQGNEFESLICEDSQGRAFVIGLNAANYNYKRYKVGDIFTIKSARCYSVSPTLSFLYYVRINHLK